MKASDIPADVRERWANGKRGMGCHCHQCTDMCHSDIPGHFIGASQCHFFEHSGNERYCVSTVGDYRPFDGCQMEIGYERTYETMVFDKSSREGRHSEVAMTGYNTEEEAAAGHRAMVLEYLGGGA